MATLVAFVAGIALWGATCVIGGRAEPWDAPVFWQVSYPTAVVISGLFGLAFPERAWRWPIYLFASLLLVMIALGADFGLLPLGLVLLAAISLPGVGLALLAARLRPSQ
jgi:hypothetical protein